MKAGRPLLPGAARGGISQADKVLVAWKDTREARRAVADALPLLHKAKDVTVVEVVEGDASRARAQDRVKDVAAWLKAARHLGIPEGDAAP